MKFFFIEQVFLAKWHDHTVVYNAMITPKHSADFQHGLKMIAAFQPQQEVSFHWLPIVFVT